MSFKMAATQLTFGPAKATESPSVVVLVGKKAAIEGGLSKYAPSVDDSVLQAMLEAAKPGDNGASTSTFLPASDGGKATKFVLAVLPDKVSRHNSPISAHSITSLVRSEAGASGDVKVIAAIEEDNNVGPVACAIAKAFPLFSAKSTKDGEEEKKERSIRTCFVRPDGSEVEDADRLLAADVAMEGVRFAARISDTPPEQMTPGKLIEEAEAVAETLKGVSVVTIRGEELAKKGYGGIWGVGKAAESPPGLVVLSYEPEGATEETETVCLVGKGIMYDTGGLSLKISGGMVGMKHDNGGAAGMLGGFIAAVKLKNEKRIHCLLCVAENAIGPKAMRNDDVLVCYSGKCVEINNTDAEGRLVLADGVAHATKHLKPSLVIDMATLTGAQMISTGRKHSAVLANTKELEERTVKAGRHSGDLAHPLIYAPELFKDEFKSKVADMKNSVKDRMNAQSSCAGTFIEQHLASDYKGGWVHIDMAGPSTSDERATGYGVGLILSLLEAKGYC